MQWSAGLQTSTVNRCARQRHEPTAIFDLVHVLESTAKQHKDQQTLSTTDSPGRVLLGYRPLARLWRYLRISPCYARSLEREPPAHQGQGRRKRASTPTNFLASIRTQGPRVPFFLSFRLARQIGLLLRAPANIGDLPPPSTPSVLCRTMPIAEG
jgi:hypothetical protein